MCKHIWCDKGEEVPGHMHSVKVNLSLLLISAQSSLLFVSLSLSPLLLSRFPSHSLPCFDQDVIVSFFLKLFPLIKLYFVLSFFPTLAHTQVIIYHWWNTSTTLQLCISHTQVIIDHWWNTSTTLQFCISHTSYNRSLMSMHVFKIYMMQRLVKWNSIGLLTLYV